MNTPSPYWIRPSFWAVLVLLLIRVVLLSLWALDVDLLHLGVGAVGGGF